MGSALFATLGVGYGVALTACSDAVADDAAQTGAGAAAVTSAGPGGEGGSAATVGQGGGSTSTSTATTATGSGGGPSSYGVNGQSCQSGLTCGTVTCCTRDEVEAGTFTMGQSDGENDETPHQASLEAFELDRFEVTVGRFRRFVESYDGEAPPPGAGAHPHLVGDSGWQSAWSLPSVGQLREKLQCSTIEPQAETWTDTPGPNEYKPINCVTWYEAFAFCAWDGGRLPTEAEWEYAAAGGDEERIYPWPNAVGGPTSSLAVFDAAGDVSAVGSKPNGAGRWGHLDLAGNVYEWALDWYGDYLGDCDNCANLMPGTMRVRRSGSFHDAAVYVRAARRGEGPADSRNDYTGFRCARSLPADAQ